jgi:hypothetical protein
MTQKGKRALRMITLPGRKASRPLGWGGFVLLYVCLFCILNTIFFVPAGNSQIASTASNEDHSLLELILELEKGGSTGESGPDTPEEPDDLVKKVEFIISPFVLLPPLVSTRPRGSNYHSFLIRSPFLALLTPPPKV